MRRPQLMLAGIWLLVVLASAGAQEIQPEQRKLLARRAAEADAYRKLAEIVYGLQINGRTYVRDFVAESDDIRTAVDSFIKGIRLGEPTWLEDGSCEVPAEVTVSKVIETLREAKDRYYKGEDIKTSDFETMARRIEKQVVRAVGQGAPRPDLPPGLPIGAIEILGGPPPPARGSWPPIWDRVGPQGRLMAAQAARVDAQRKLAERIMGLRLTARTVVRDFVAESDEITANLNTYLRTGGEERDRPYFHHDELIAEVTLRIPTEQVIATIRKLHSRYYNGDDDDIQGHDIEDVVKHVVKRDFEATGMGVPPRKFIEQYAQAAQIVLPPWAMEALTATGQGTDPEFGTPQGRLRATRAAELDARRRLAEKIAGLKVEGATAMRDVTAGRDEIETLIDAFIANAAVVDTRLATDTATVTVSLPGMQLWDVVNDAGPPAGADRPPPPVATPPPVRP